MSDISEVCKEKHVRLDERLEQHDKRLDYHEKKIDVLEKSDAANTTEIKNLCIQIGSQTKAIWGLVFSVISALVGFFIWYIQSIGG